MTTEKPIEESKPEPEEEVKAEQPEAEPAEPVTEEPVTEEPEPDFPPPPPPPPGMEDRRDFWDTAATYLKKAKEEVVRSSRIGKIRLDIARLKKQRKDLLSKFGEKAYELLSAGELSAGALEELKAQVDEKNALVAAKEAEIEAITAEEEAEAEAEAEEKDKE
jgi:colicin import membrane protein